MSIQQTIREMGRDARKVGLKLSRASSQQKNGALLHLASLLQSSQDLIRSENLKDLEAAQKKGLSGAKLDRLRLSDKVLKDLIQGLNEVAALPDPVGELLRMWTRPNGLKVGRMRIPLGVIGIIYESRPNVTIEAAALCMKAGNAIVLRGGSEAFHSNMCLTRLFQQSLEQAGLPAKSVQLVGTTDRAAVAELLKLEDSIDVMIPRGGESLIRFVAENARMPVLKHYKGVCHVFVDKAADFEMAKQICINAKVQRPGVCNAMETLLIHEDIAEKFVPLIVQEMKEKGVTMFGCEKTRAYAMEIEAATEEDWHQEYLDLRLAIRVLPSLEDVMEHIATYGSDHTEAIVTENYERAMRFVNEVHSSLVLVNASTRFNDGFQLGLGAEIGISTSRLHAFGPMGLDELTTAKFIAFGQGQIRD